jgi:glycosyltransferase involved in cell wall biosynthesis
LGWDADKKYILFGGAFSNERKNYKLLAEAVEKLHSTLDIVCIEMKGLTRAECVLRMCAADLFALPSHSEGSPQALKEAMAVNCPCLATDIADVRELFGDEPGHFILRNPRKTHERWDADERSLDEMVELLRRALAFEGRTNGRQRILDLELTNEQVAKRIIEIYNKVL